MTLAIYGRKHMHWIETYLVSWQYATFVCKLLLSNTCSMFLYNVLMKKMKNALRHLDNAGYTMKLQNASDTLIRLILFNFLKMFSGLLTAILFWERDRLGKYIELCVLSQHYRLSSFSVVVNIETLWILCLRDRWQVTLG